MSGGEIRFGIIGCGWAAGSFAESCQTLPGTSIAAVTDIDRRRATALAQRTGAAVCSDIAALLDRADIDVVYVSLPHALIAPAVERDFLLKLPKLAVHARAHETFARHLLKELFELALPAADHGRPGASATPRRG